MWKRVVAALVDALVVGVPFFVVYVVLPVRFIVLIAQPLALMVWIGYLVYLHGRDGRTVGKSAARIRVVTVEGNAIGFGRAALRVSVGATLGAAATVAGIIGLIALPAETLDGLDGLRRFEVMDAAIPASLAWIVTLSSLWTYTDLLAVFVNRRRRALHDYIAGTVVVTDPPRAYP